MAPFGKVNLFAGANNTGKSNVLRFLVESFAGFLVSAKAGHEIQPELDLPAGHRPDRSLEEDSVD